jgi:hypothetical protein
MKKIKINQHLELDNFWNLFNHIVCNQVQNEVWDLIYIQIDDLKTVLYKDVYESTKRNT